MGSCRPGSRYLGFAPLARHGILHIKLQDMPNSRVADYSCGKLNTATKVLAFSSPTAELWLQPTISDVNNIRAYCERISDTRHSPFNDRRATSQRFCRTRTGISPSSTLGVGQLQDLLLLTADRIRGITVRHIPEGESNVISKSFMSIPMQATDNTNNARQRKPNHSQTLGK